MTRTDGEEYSRQEKMRLERRMKLKKLVRDKQEIEDLIEQEGKARETVDQKLKDDQDKERAIRKEINNKREREKLLEKELQELKNTQGSEQHLAVFGAKIPQLEAAIKKHRQHFRLSPIGPVGAHVKLTGEAANNSDVARLVETELTRAMITSYLCDNDEDRRQLSRLCEEVFSGDRGKPRIFTSKFIYKKHEVRSANIASNNRECSVLMNLLQIDNPVVFNHLVDQKNIENIVVCRTQDYAKSITTKKENVPDNVSYVITHDYYRFHPPRDQHSYRSYHMDALQGSGMLRSTMTNLLMERGQEMEGLSQHLSDLEQELTAVERSKQSYDAEKKRSAAEIQKLRGRYAQINTQMSQIKAEEDNAEDDADNIRAKISTRTQELNVVEDKIQETLNEREMLTDLIKEKDSLFKENKKELNQLKSATSPLLKQQRETETMISNRTKEILNQEKVVKRLNSDKDGLLNQIKALQIEETQFKNSALKLTDGEIVPERSMKQLDVKIKKLRDKIKNKQKDINLEEFYEEYGNLRERYTSMKKQIEKLENILQTIAKMNADRLDNFICIRTIITNNVRRRFNLMIKEFSKQVGSSVFLRIDNANKELKFSFSAGSGSSSYTSSDVSLLSGGEKSYTQMCLICALWDMMKPPFRCLDEWDVFLDAVNRKNISEELLRFCLRNPDKQFIFISPQVSIITNHSHLIHFSSFAGSL